MHRPVVPVYTRFLDQSISAFQSISRNSEGHMESVQPIKSMLFILICSKCYSTLATFVFQMVFRHIYDWNLQFKNILLKDQRQPLVTIAPFCLSCLGPLVYLLPQIFRLFGIERTWWRLNLFIFFFFKQQYIFIQNACYILTSKSQATYGVFHINILLYN